ncbi:MAG: hypothetical protein R6U27_04650 [Desulfobacterales bacterium]
MEIPATTGFDLHPCGWGVIKTAGDQNFLGQGIGTELKECENHFFASFRRVVATML